MAHSSYTSRHRAGQWKWWLGLGTFFLLVITAAKLRSNLLAHAAITGDMALAQLSLAVGADPNARCSSDEWVDVAENLVGTQLHHVNRMPVLWMAASYRHPPIVRLLLSAKADPNARDGAGATALGAAVENNDRESVHLLLKAGANPNARWKDNSTILENLPKRTDPQIIAMLKQAGAKP